MITSSIAGIICSQLLLQDGRINYEEFVAMMRKGNPELAPTRRRK
jgi:calcium-dependent protein kinase